VVAEGSVGAGTGTICFGWKGGIGTSSRKLPNGFTLGVLVQTNYGGYLTMGGAPVYKELSPNRENNGDGSCMIVVATDAPLTTRDLKRVAARSAFGLARTGSSYSHGSGDFAIAFSTRSSPALPSEQISPLFQAALECTEEAVYNSLLQATVTGNSRIRELPVDALKQVLAKYRLGL
jgi:D-aminopeptidase